MGHAGTSLGSLIDALGHDDVGVFERRQFECRRQNPDNSGCLSIEGDGFPQNVLCHSESALPQPVGDHRHACSIRDILLRQEIPATQQSDPERGQKVGFQVCASEVRWICL